MRVSPLGARLCRSAAAALPLPTLQHAWLRSQCCSSRGRLSTDVRTFSSSANANAAKKRVVFLGTPEVAALALKELLQASQVPSSTFEVAAVVSQPGKPKGRGNKAVPIPSPVEQLARSSGIADDRILCPKSAREASFLAALTDLQPDLCVTAAYGNMLPTAFLDIPKHGTLNIHPSLLPQYRGAAPVPRALQDGVSETGVSVAFTVLRCDAGPVLAQQRIQVPDNVQAPQLLEQLFALGSKLLVSVLDDVWAGRAAAQAWPQDESQATHAAKMSKEEGILDFSQPARTLHNKVRAFAGWPGTTAAFTIVDDAAGRSETLVYKVLSTRVVDGSELQETLRQGEVAFLGSQMLVPCGDGTVLEVLQLQPPAKKAISARDFKNGLGKKRVLIPASSTAASPPKIADTVAA